MKYIIVGILMMTSCFLMGQTVGKTSKVALPAEASKERVVTSQSPKDLAKANADKIAKSLKLNDQQTKEIHKAFLDYEVAMEKISKSNLSTKDQYAKVTETRKKRQQSLKTTLTKEQYKTYQLSFP